MKKSIVFFYMVLLLVVAIFLFSGCTSTQHIKIGIAVDLSGKSYESGIGARNAVYLLTEKINASGGIKGRTIDIVIRDDKGTAEGAKAAMNALAIEGVTAVIGNITSSTAIAGKEVADAKNILLISPTASSNSLFKLDDNLITILGSNMEQGKILSERALKEIGPDKVAVVYDENNKVYAMEIIKSISDVYLNHQGAAIKIFSFDSYKKNDFAMLGKEVASVEPKGVLLIAGGSDTGIIAQRIKAQRPDIKLYGTSWPMTQDVIKLGGAAVEGMTFTSAYDELSTKSEFVAFKDEYIKKYSKEPNVTAVLAYDAALALFEVMKTVDHPDAKRIKANIINRSYKGLQADFSIDAMGDSNRPYQVFVLREYEFFKVN